MAPVRVDIEVAGITWIELFALFDLTGNRSVNGQHQTNPEATTRAGQRRQKATCARSKKQNLNETTVVTKPSLDEEIKLFKAIVRHVTKHEAGQGKANWFKADARANLRRLNDLGVSGHQAAIKACCQMTKQEKAQVVEAILKAEAIFIEHRERQNQAETSEEASLQPTETRYSSELLESR